MRESTYGSSDRSDSLKPMKVRHGFVVEEKKKEREEKMVKR